MDLWELILGFMDSQVLLTAEELGVFDYLDAGPRTAEEVSTAIDICLDSTRRLLTALCALGLTQRQPDGRYINGPEASEQLVSTKPNYIGMMFVHLREDLYPVWHYFTETLRECQPQWERAFGKNAHPTEQMYSDPDTLRAFMGGMHAISYKAATEFAAVAPELETVRHLVDVGGASGAFVIAVCQAHPQLRGTVMDLPQVGPIVNDFARMSGLEDRIDFYGADFFNDPFPKGVDAFSLGFVLHDWDTEQGSYLLEQVSQAIEPGGLLMIGEYLLNEDRTGPLFVARSDLNMLVAAQGRERTAQEYADWIAQYGFVLQRAVLTSMGKNFLIARHTG
jgi:hypothetical protein